MNDGVAAEIRDGGKYEFLVKFGTDGQTGRGKFAIKGKKVDDNKTSVFAPLALAILALLALTILALLVAGGGKCHCCKKLKQLYLK